MSVKARNPKQKPCPEDFDTFDHFILCAYDAQEWYDGLRKYTKAVFNQDRPPEQHELNIIAEQQAHWDFYKKMREDYWEKRRKYEASIPVSIDTTKSFREVELGCRCQCRCPCQCD